MIIHTNNTKNKSFLIILNKNFNNSLLSCSFCSFSVILQKKKKKKKKKLII